MTKLITVGTPDIIIADDNFVQGDLVVINGIDSEEREVDVEGEMVTQFFVTAIHVNKFESDHSSPWGIIGEDVTEGEEVEKLYLCIRWFDRL